MSTRTIVVAIASAYVLGVSGTVLAQDATPRSTGGLFGRRTEQPTSQKLDFNGSVLEAYDDDVYADGGPAFNPLQDQVSGYYSLFEVSGSYEWRGRRSHFGTTGGSAVRYYHKEQEVQLTSFTGGLGFSSQLTTRTSIFLNQNVSYSPSFFYRLFPDTTTLMPGTVPPAGADYTINNDSYESYSYGTNVSITHKIGPRSSLTASTDFGYTNFVRESPTQRDANAYGVRGEFARSLSRNTVARVGYRYRSGDVGFGAAVPTVEHGLDIGVDYTRPLSATRRATFGFAFGTSAVSLPESTLALASGQVYRGTGSATFGYEFSRSWQVKSSYRRGLDYVPGLDQPVFTDGFTTVVEGLFGPRWDVSAAASYSSGEPAYFTQTATYKTYAGNVRFRYALTRLLAIHGEYLYYFYDFTGALVLPQDAPPSLERNGVRVGVTWWVPALRR